MMPKGIAAAIVAALVTLGLSTASPADQMSNAGQQIPKVRVGVLAFGTANWELDTIKTYELDRKHGVDLVISGHTNKSPAAVALQARAVDVILTDYIWVSRQRAAGSDFTFVPHSLAVGGLMVGKDSGIRSINDLEGKRIGIAGGPVDKSWLILRAYGEKKLGVDIADIAEPKFGAPPLINELLIKGDVDAVLNFWHYNAHLKAMGYEQVIGIAEMLPELGIQDDSPLLGWTFSESWAGEHKNEIAAFLAASQDAKTILLEDDGAWVRLKERIDAPDEATFLALRDAYREGIVTAYGRKEIEAAKQTFAILAELGGKELVGDSDKLADGTFWTAYGF